MHQNSSDMKYDFSSNFRSGSELNIDNYKIPTYNQKSGQNIMRNAAINSGIQKKSLDYLNNINDSKNSLTQ